MATAERVGREKPVLPVSEPCPACSACEATERGALEFKGLPALPVLLCCCGHRWLRTDAALQTRIEARYGHHYAGFRVDPHFVRVVGNELESRIRHLTPTKPSLLDVGCGNGEFLRVAAGAGFDCHGIDISEASAELCKSKGVRARSGDFLSFPFQEQFDIVTMWDVMEHLREPFDFAQRAHSLLGPQGTLILKIPSPGELMFQFLRLVPRRGSLLVGAPGHVQYFTEASLGHLLRRAGFREVLWFDSVGFRKRRRTWNPRRLLARKVASFAGRMAKNTNLYVYASKGGFAPGVVSQLRHRRHEQLLAG